MKKIMLIMLLVFALFLAACAPTVDDNDDDDDNGELEPTAQEIFEEKFEFLVDNNYELEIKIRDHQTLKDTIVMMYFDGNVVQYVDADYIAYYDHSGSQSKMYVKQGESYAVSNVSSGPAGLLYYGFEFAQFTKNNDTSYIMIAEQHSTLDSFIALGDGVSSIDSLQIRVNETHLTEVIFNVVVGETTYLITMTISNVGQVELVLPV